MEMVGAGRTDLEDSSSAVVDETLVSIRPGERVLAVICRFGA